MKIKIKDQEVELTTLISVGTLVVILLSYYNTVMMYGLFGVNIISFLDPSEIIFSFTQLFVISLLFTVTFLTVSALIATLKDRPVDPESKFYRFFKYRDHLFTVLFGILAFGLMSMLLDMMGISLRAFERILTIALLLFINMDKKVAQNLKYMFIVTLFLGFMSERNVRYNTWIRNGKPEFFVEMQTDKYHVVSDQCLVYYGSTKNYIFFWDVTKKQTKVYSTTNLEWITMKRNGEFSL
jgi:hypothetical protein